MPLDTEYNRQIAKQYNDMNRKKVAYLDNNYLDVNPAPVGYDVTGYEPRKTVGSGVGVYKKGGCCGGANPGLKKNIRMELNYGAGIRGDRIGRRGLDEHNELTKKYQDLMNNGSGKAYGMAYGKKKGGAENDKVRKCGFSNEELQQMVSDLSNAEGEKEVMDYLGMGKARGRAYGKKKRSCSVSSSPERKKGKGTAFTMSANPEPDVYGGKKKNQRAEIVKKIMKDKGMKMIEASKYVKEHNLYKK